MSAGLLSNLSAFILGGSLYLTLLWWGLLLMVGLAFFPLVACLCPRFYDRGYLLGKTLGVALSGYTAWLLSSLHVVPFARVSALAAGLLAAAGASLLCGSRISVGPVLTRKWRIFVAEEGLFLLCLLLWSFVRSLSPELGSIEKPMDYGFLNAALHTAYFPPRDPWFANASINYYYFGHVLTAWLTKLSGLDPAYTCNLMLATLFASASSLAFSLASNLLRLAGQFSRRAAVAGGLVAAALLGFGGNLHTLIFFVIPSVAQKLHCTLGGLTPVWWCEASRFVGYNPPTQDKTISEFPAYSYINADLHAHTLALPISLTYLSLLLALYLEMREGAKAATRPLGWRRFLLAGVLLGVLYMTNAWTLPIYLIATAAVVLAAAPAPRLSLRVVLKAAPVLALMVVTFVLAIVPFQMHFHSPAHGVRPVAYSTPLYQLFVLWGYQALVVVWYWWPRWRAHWHTGHTSLPELPLADRFAAVITLGAAFLIAVPELIYVKDIYGLEFARANTMFKLTYEASAILSVCVGYYVVAIAARATRAHHRAVLATLACLVAAPLLFGPVALAQAYHFVIPADYEGLNGMAYVERSAPDEWAAVLWLRQNAPRRATILEADGDSYSDAGRIAIATGLPTVLGWGNHEWTWRGSNDLVNERSEDVRAAYTSKDINDVEDIVDWYRIDYVIIGKRERARFDGAPALGLRGLGHVVYSRPGIEVLAVHVNPRPRPK